MMVSLSFLTVNSMIVPYNYYLQLQGVLNPVKNGLQRGKIFNLKLIEDMLEGNLFCSEILTGNRLKLG